MNKYLPVTVFYFLLFLTLSCSKSNPAQPAEIKIDKASITLNGGFNAKDSFYIEFNGSWAITVTPENNQWLTIDVSTGVNNSKVIIGVNESNTTGLTRAASVTIAAALNTSFEPVTLSVTQRAATTEDSVAMLTGKWKHVMDSSTNVGDYYFKDGGTNYFPTAGVYNGIEGEYWDFGSNGTLSTYANQNLFHLAYELYPNNRLFIPEMMAHDTGRVGTLTATHATIYWNNTSDNGGRYHRSVFLQK